MESTSSTSAAPLADIVTKFIALRDARSELKEEFTRKDTELAARMEEFEQQMLDTCKQLGIDSVRTPAGTIIRSVKSRYWTNDWDSIWKLITKHNAFGLMEKRLHQAHMREFLEQHPELHPIGLNVEKEYTVVVRRATGS